VRRRSSNRRLDLAEAQDALVLPAKPDFSNIRETWPRLDGHNQLPKIILGVRLTEGPECNAPNRQEGQRMQLIDAER
jgi:hypothetical protein